MASPPETRLTEKEIQVNANVLEYVRRRLMAGEMFTGQIVLHCKADGIRRIQVSDFLDAEDVTP